MCGNENCRFICIFYLTDDDEKVMIHYDNNFKPIWIQHFCKNEIETDFIPDVNKTFDTQHKYRPKDIIYEPNVNDIYIEYEDLNEY